MILTEATVSERHAPPSHANMTRGSMSLRNSWWMNSFINPINVKLFYYISIIVNYNRRAMYHRQQNKCYPKAVYLPISKLHSITAVANLLAHNNKSQICHCGQISSQSSAFKCSFSDYLIPRGSHLFCWWWYK